MNNAQVAATFGDQQVTIWQEGQTEGSWQPLGQECHFNIVLLCRVKNVWRFFQRVGSNADRWFFSGVYSACQQAKTKKSSGAEITESHSAHPPGCCFIRVIPDMVF